VTSALLANGYRKRFIIDSTKPKWSPQQSAVAAPEDIKNFCVRAKPIKRVLNSYNIKVTLKPHLTIGSLFPKPREPVPKDRARGVIYSIPYKDCDKHSSGRPNGNSILGTENAKKRQTKTSQEIRTCRTLFYNLVTLSRGNRLQYHVPAQVGETDAS